MKYLYDYFVKNKLKWYFLYFPVSFCCLLGMGEFYVSGNLSSILISAVISAVYVLIAWKYWSVFVVRFSEKASNKYTPFLLSGLLISIFFFVAFKNVKPSNVFNIAIDYFMFYVFLFFFLDKFFGMKLLQGIEDGSAPKWALIIDRVSAFIFGIYFGFLFLFFGFKFL